MLKLFYSLLFVVAACEQSPGKKQESKGVILKSETVQLKNDCADYSTKKTVCTTLLNSFRSNPNTVTQSYLLKYLTDSLMSCWYGTPWDFNGCTRLPGKGSIACGYFITTVLQDAGIKLNRIKLAQSPSQIIIYRLCKNVSVFSNQQLPDFINEIKIKGEGLYIVGLDFHTGFIYNDSTEIYFIHSSYYQPKCVIKEIALNSAVLRSSKYRVVGKVNFL